jgi:phosphoserine phosphatase
MTDLQPGDKPETLLLTLSGKDRPGVTSSVFTALSGAGVEVLDIEQIVLRSRLILGILVTAPRNPKRVRAAVQETAEGLGMSVDIDGGVEEIRLRLPARVA